MLAESTDRNQNSWTEMDMGRNRGTLGSKMDRIASEMAGDGGRQMLFESNTP